VLFLLTITVAAKQTTPQGVGLHIMRIRIVGYNGALLLTKFPQSCLKCSAHIDSGGPEVAVSIEVTLGYVEIDHTSLQARHVRQTNARSLSVKAECGPLSPSLSVGFRDVEPHAVVREEQDLMIGKLSVQKVEQRNAIVEVKADEHVIEQEHAK
jgi:hypothetical protein